MQTDFYPMAIPGPRADIFQCQVNKWHIISHKVFGDKTFDQKLILVEFEGGGAQIFWELNYLSFIFSFLIEIKN